MKPDCFLAAALVALLWLGIASGAVSTGPTVDAGPPAAALVDPLPPAAAGDDGPIQTVIAWIEPGEACRPDMMYVGVLVHEDWWIHSLVQRGRGTHTKRTRIVLEADGPRRLGAVFEPVVPPFRTRCVDVPEFAGVVFEQHRGFVVWMAPIVGEGPLEVRGAITVQADSEYACATPETYSFVARPLDPAD